MKKLVMCLALSVVLMSTILPVFAQEVQNNEMENAEMVNAEVMNNDVVMNADDAAPVEENTMNAVSNNVEAQPAAGSGY